MRYDRIYNNDMLNGTGFRVVLFVTGCSHKCDGCYNKSTWNPCNGTEYTKETERELIDMLRSPHIDGLTLTGGDPFYRDNLETVLELVKAVKRELPEKTIWLWSGYTYELSSLHPKRKEILQYVDFFMDGKYVKELPTDKPFRGSDNQKLYELYANSIEVKNIS